MSKKLIIFLVILAVFIFGIYSGYSYFKSTYNQIVLMDEGTKQGWAQVENVYQRRLDLIPNIVNSVKGAADFEKSTFTAVAEARSKASQINVDPAKLTPEAIQQFQKSQSGVSSALSRLLVVVERYPNLKATQAFSDLITELEGTENRISVERRRFNQTIGVFNSFIRQFPSNFIAGFFQFTPKGYFEADAGASEAPTVDFN